MPDTMLGRGVRMVNKVEIVHAFMIPRVYWGMQQIGTMIGEAKDVGGYIDGLLDSFLEGQERFPGRSRFVVTLVMSRG